MFVEFEQAHEQWIQSHLARRSGERKSRLERGHGYAEKLFVRRIWWKLTGSFDGLHPEYEVTDWRGRPYYADFAWMPGFAAILFEIKGFGPHVRDMDRKRYCDECNRETFLQALGFRVVSIACDDVEERPDLVMNLLRMLMSRYMPARSPATPLALAEKEIVLLAGKLGRPLRPIDVSDHLSINYRTTRRCLQALCNKGWLRPVVSADGNASRVSRYVLAGNPIETWAW